MHNDTRTKTFDFVLFLQFVFFFFFFSFYSFFNPFLAAVIVGVKFFFNENELLSKTVLPDRK